jgi:hypothetical protein
VIAIAAVATPVSIYAQQQQQSNFAATLTGKGHSSKQLPI